MQLTIAPLMPAALPVLPFDIVWDGSAGDFAVETDPARAGVGGLQARNPLESAVIMLLFSDQRCEIRDLKIGLNGDRRGWVGDGFDVDTANGETALGSRWWLYRRSTLDDAVAMQMAADTKAALNPLIVQQACVRIDATPAIVSPWELHMAVQLYGRDGRQVYAGKFGTLWARAGGGV